MCMFSRPARHVSGTSICARTLAGWRVALRDLWPDADTWTGP